MFFFQGHPVTTWAKSISRLCWTSVLAGVLATVLFLLPLLVISQAGYAPQAWPAVLLTWLAASGSGGLAVVTGFLSHWRVRADEQHSMLLAVVGGALGLASLILALFAAAGLLWQVVMLDAA